MPDTGKVQITITCAKCGKETKKSLAWLSKDRQFPCQKCGVAILTKGNDAIVMRQKIRDAKAGLIRDFKR